MNSVRSIMGQQTPTTLMSVVGTILTEVGSIKRVSPVKTKRRIITIPSSSKRKLRLSALMRRGPMRNLMTTTAPEGVGQVV
jgi:hypothetical protein